MDRGFDGAEFLREVAAARAQFLVRLTSVHRPQILCHLPDRPFISLIGGMKVRLITASSQSPAQTAPPTAAATGWPPPCARQAASCTDHVTNIHHRGLTPHWACRSEREGVSEGCRETSDLHPGED